MPLFVTVSWGTFFRAAARNMGLTLLAVSARMFALASAARDRAGARPELQPFTPADFQPEYSARMGTFKEHRPVRRCPTRRYVSAKTSRLSAAQRHGVGRGQPGLRKMGLHEHAGHRAAERVDTCDARGW